MPRIKKQQFQSVKGMHDILPQDEGYWRKLERVIEEFADFYNFSLIEPPTVEPAEVYRRTTGETSDIVQKEMYYLRSRGEDLVLRPEINPGIARAFIEHGLSSLPEPQKFYYLPLTIFRHETPQAGRYRQAHQFGFEIFSEENAAADAQVINIFVKILNRLGLKNISLQVNSIGCKICRPNIREALKSYYRNKINSLCKDCQVRYKENILRLLDCKNENCIALRANAPAPIDSLCKDCTNHFKSLLEYLDSLTLSYELSPNLVRGLDYYSRTVFEIAPESNKQLALVGGGRYDYLVETLGGQKTPAVGGSAGAERIIETLKQKGENFLPKKPAKIFLIQLGEAARKLALKLIEEFRQNDLPVYESLGRDSLKAQLRSADRLKVDYTLILGQEEVLKEEIILRQMQSGIQEKIVLDTLIPEMKKRLKTKDLSIVNPGNHQNSNQNHQPASPAQ